jgi:hypothetical protein
MGGPYDQAVAAGILTDQQAKKLEAFLASSGTPQVGIQSPAPRPRFDLAHVLWYFGALIIISAMGLFSNMAFELMGAGALLATAVIYAVGFVLLGHRLWHRNGLVTPGGLLIAAAVSMVPLAIFAIQDMSGLWGELGKPGQFRSFYHWIKGGFVPMEVGTILAALVAIRFYRFPFILFIAAVALWFMSMDLAEWLKGSSANFSERRQVSLVFGLVLIPVAWAIELRQRDQDFGFWIHLVGIATFWGGLTFQESSSELGKFLYFLINLGLIGFAVYLSRRAYAVFGGIGVMIYLGHLSGKVFKNVLLFPFALSLIGLAIIGLGVLYFRNADKIEQTLERKLPAFLLRLRPRHVRHSD